MAPPSGRPTEHDGVMGARSGPDVYPPNPPTDPDPEDGWEEPRRPVRRERARAHGEMADASPELIRWFERHKEALAAQPRPPPRPRPDWGQVLRCQTTADASSAGIPAVPGPARPQAQAPLSGHIFGTHLGPVPMLVQAGDEPFVVGPFFVADGAAQVPRPTGYHPPEKPEKRPFPSPDDRPTARRRANGH